MSGAVNPDEFLDGLALWEEHRPLSGEDWLAVGRRFVAGGGDRSLSSPLFAGLALAVEALADAEAARVGAVADADRLREALELVPRFAHGTAGAREEMRRSADAALSARVSPAGVILTHDVCAACGDADHGNLDCDSCRTWQYQEGNLDDPREDGTAV